MRRRRRTPALAADYAEINCCGRDGRCGRGRTWATRRGRSGSCAGGGTWRGVDEEARWRRGHQQSPRTTQRLTVVDETDVAGEEGRGRRDVDEARVAQEAGRGGGWTKRQDGEGGTSTRRGLRRKYCCAGGRRGRCGGSVKKGKARRVASRHPDSALKTSGRGLGPEDLRSGRPFTSHRSRTHRTAICLRQNNRSDFLAGRCADGPT
jgi:hypothetical protein